MSVTQTVDIPASRRLVIDVPREVPEGRTVLTFTPAASPRDTAGRKKMTEKSEERDIELFKLHAEELNREAMDVLSYQSLNPEYDFDI